MTTVLTPQRHRTRPAPGWWRDTSVAASWAVVLLTVVLWVRGGGAGTLLTDLPTSLGRLTGLVASALLLLQVVLMARIPWFEQAWGQDGLTRAHRRVGVTSFWLMVAHLVLITVGYAGAAGVLATFVDLVLRLPGMLLALAGTACLVMVVATSVRVARRRLRYESWHLLHLYAYLGAGLALPHQLWTGRDFTSSPAATVFWWGLYGVALGAVLVWRVAVPLWRSLRSTLRVVAVERTGSGVTTVTVAGRDAHGLPVRAGQFFVWRFLTGPGWTRGHPFSLSAAPTARTLRFTVAHVGDGTAAVARLRPGTRVLVEGPYGRLHAGVRTRRKVLLLGSGIGITPLRALLEELEQQPGEVTVLHRVHDRASAVLAEELRWTAEERGARYRLLEGPRAADGRIAPVGYAHLSDAELLRQLVPDLAEHDVYLCGSPIFMAAARTVLLANGLPVDQLHAEHFTV